MRIVRSAMAALAVLVTVLIASVPSTRAGPLAPVDWPQFRFDNNRTGFQPFETTLGRRNVPMLQLAWQAQLGTTVVSSSPAVVGGTVYIGSSEGVLWAYPAEGCGQSLCTTPLWKSTNLAQIIYSPRAPNRSVS